MSTKGWEDGMTGDENDVVYGPSAMARRAEEDRKQMEKYLKPASQMTIEELETEIANRKGVAEKKRQDEHRQLRQQVAKSAQNALHADISWTKEERMVLQRAIDLLK